MSNLDIILYELLFYLSKIKHLIWLAAGGALLVATTAMSEPVNGASYIGICSPRFPCTQALKAFPRGVYNLGYLNETFGADCGCVRRFQRLSKGQGYVRVHAVNGTCFPSRGRSCAEGEWFHGESVRSATNKLVKRDAKFIRSYKKHLEAADRQTIGFDSSRISLCLECPLPNNARRIMLSIAKRTLPHRNGQFVDSPIIYGCLRGTICERHGVTPRFKGACISDNDGTELTRSSLSSYLQATKSCESRYYWTRAFNLLPPVSKGAGFVMPKERTYKATRRDFMRLRRFMRYSSL